MKANALMPSCGPKDQQVILDAIAADADAGPRFGRCVLRAGRLLAVSL